jgi:glucose-6-phosphate-specific signal transduction histidine kinase
VGGESSVFNTRFADGVNRRSSSSLRGLRNAFSHARAHHIEAELIHAERLFRLRIRDDGKGIEPAMLEEGRSGHYGLPGMRERARQIGAEFTIRSTVGTGTEIELRIPGSIAYRTLSRRFRWIRRKVG